MIQDVIAPGLKNSLYIYESYLQKYVKPRINWLELGCGHQLFPDWYNNSSTIEKELTAKTNLCVGVDYDYSSIAGHKNIKMKVRALIDELPFKKDIYDLVTLNYVAEHLRNPGNALREIKAVLKPGGICIIHTTNKHSYLSILGRITPRKFKSKLIYHIDGRKENDIFDTCFKLNDSKTIKNIAKQIGLDIISLRMTVTSVQFRKIFPVNILELIWMRVLMLNISKNLRTNIIAVFQKPA